MDMTHGYWDNDGQHGRVKYEGCNTNEDLHRSNKEDRGVYQCCETNLNFSTAVCSEDDSEYGSYKKNKVTRQDPMSHRIIEKRRRDRMNNCLADLSRLIPTEYLKKGRGRIEKTEIIEMAIKHMKYLQQEHGNPSEHYRMGYQECMSETMRFMVEVEGHFPREGVCLRILNHLQKHCENVTRLPAAGSAQAAAAAVHQVSDYQTTHIKEPNNNNGPLFTADENTATTPTPSAAAEENNCDSKHHHECSNAAAASYKYKNNIKMRFSQDLHEVTGNKRQKMECNGRRASFASVENHSSSHSSPPSSETMTRMSEPETSRISPSESCTTSSSLTHLKMEPAHQIPHHPYSKSVTDKNYAVPIFVLHAKGSYYIPLTIDYKSLVPYLRNQDILEVDQAMHNVVLHPVNINVNFQPNKYNNWN